MDNQPDFLSLGLADIFQLLFFLKDKDHVAFDILYQAAPPNIKKLMGLIGSSLIIATMAYAFIPTWDAIFDNRLMTLKKLQTLRMPITGDKIAIKWLFAPYIMLMIAVVAHYAWRIVSLLRGLHQSYRMMSASRVMNNEP